MLRTIPFSDILAMWGAINEQIGIQLKDNTVLFTDKIDCSMSNGITGYFYSNNTSNMELDTPN